MSSVIFRQMQMRAWDDISVFLLDKTNVVKSREIDGRSITFDFGNLYVNIGSIEARDDFSRATFPASEERSGYDVRLILNVSKLITGVGAIIRLRGWDNINAISIGYTLGDIVTNIKARKVAFDDWFSIEFDHSDLAFLLTNDWKNVPTSAVSDIRLYIDGKPGAAGATIDLRSMCFWMQSSDSLTHPIDLAPKSDSHHRVVGYIWDYFYDFWGGRSGRKNFVLDRECLLVYGKSIISWNYLERTPPTLKDSVSFRFSWHAWHPVVSMLLNYNDTKSSTFLNAAYGFANGWLDSSYFNIDSDAKYCWYDHGTAERLICMVLLYTLGLENMFDPRFVSRLRHVIFKHGELLASEAFYAYTQDYRYHNHAWFQDFALIVTSLVIDDFPCSKHWLALATHRLEDQVRHLVVNDNNICIFLENSIGYHVGIILLLEYISKLLKCSGMDTNIPATTKGLLAFSNLMSYPDKRHPSYGDTYRSPNLSTRTHSPPASARELTASIFPVAGYGIVKGEHDGIPYALTTIASSLSSTHKHEDNLSFSLYFDGVEWLIDPGFYSHDYEQPIAAYLRSAIAHNTIAIPELPYSLKPGLATIEGSSSGSQFQMKMAHNCYANFIISREIDGSLVSLDLHFLDQIMQQDSLAEQYTRSHLVFHCGEFVSASQHDNTVRLTHPASEYTIEIELPVDAITLSTGSVNQDATKIRGIAGYDFLKFGEITTIECAIDLGVIFSHHIRALKASETKNSQRNAE